MHVHDALLSGALIIVALQAALWHSMKTKDGRARLVRVSEADAPLVREALNRVAAELPEITLVIHDDGGLRATAGVKAGFALGQLDAFCHLVQSEVARRRLELVDAAEHASRARKSAACEEEEERQRLQRQRAAEDADARTRYAALVTTSADESARHTAGCGVVALPPLQARWAGPLKADAPTPGSSDVKVTRAADRHCATLLWGSGDPRLIARTIGRDGIQIRQLECDCDCKLAFYGSTLEVQGRTEEIVREAITRLLEFRATIKHGSWKDPKA
jgi:hypothetical protein